MFRHLTFCLVLLTALSACGGGGSTGSSLPGTPPAPAPPAGLQSITMSIRIPAAPTGGSSLRRTPLYISAKTQSASIAVNKGTPVIVNLGPTSPNCSPSPGGRTCKVSLSAPVGVDTFTEILYQSTDGTGPALSQSTTTAPITAGIANVVSIVLDGVIASIGMTLQPASPPVGPKATIALIVNLNDASGEQIIGSDPFINPVTLKDSDTTGITSLTKTALTSPSDVVGLSVNYSGQPLASAVFTATAAGVASASATLTPQNGGPVSFNDYSTFGFDNQHDVYNPNSTAITPTNVANLHLAWQAKTGGNGDFNVQSQPVLATEIPNHAGVLFVSGSSGNVFAHDALTGASLWTTFTGTELYDCGGAPATFGAGTTVAYDPTTKSLYVVGNKNSGPNAYAQNLLFHLDGATGSVLGTPVDFGVSPAGSSELNFGHTSVTLASNGMAYVGTGSTCDISSWRGRVAAIDTRTMSLANTFFTVWDPNNARGQGAQPWGGGGVWGWGGVSLDLNGNVLTGVGNTDNGQNNGQVQPPFAPAPLEYSGYGESLVQISGDLSTVAASNHPIDPAIYGGNSGYAVDLDVNGTPAIFKPLGAGCPTMAALQAKSGTLFMYDTSRISSGPSAQFQLSPSTFDDGFLGEPAFSQATGLVYADAASPESPNLYPPGMIAINPGCGSPAVTWHRAFGPDSTVTGVPRSVPAVSAGGVVFVASSCDVPSGLCSANGGYGALWELDASTGTILNGGNPVLYTNATIRAPATIDGNWVYVVDLAGEMYGLTIDPSFPKIAATRRSVDTRQFFKRRAPMPSFHHN